MRVTGGIGLGLCVGHRLGQHETVRGADVLLEVIATPEELYVGK